MKIFEITLKNEQVVEVMADSFAFLSDERSVYFYGNSKVVAAFSVDTFSHFICSEADQ